MAETAKEQIEEAGGIEAIQERLEEKREEIVEMYEQDIRAGQEAVEEAAEDIVDRATRASSRELLFSLSDAERQTLLQIEEALERIEGGSYGLCVNCEEPIAAARLKAVPWARYCFGCQELAERDALE